jgi:hypothetical protein
MPHRSSDSLRKAFDELTFGPARTLNLRATRPTASEAATRAEAWLRERQAAKAGEVLVITGRGNGSADGVSVVREALLRLFPSLRRRGVISGIQEHTPGSFVVTLAPMSDLFDAPRRRREKTPPPVADPPTLAGLDAETRALLRRLAIASLATLGVHSPDQFVESEMLRQFSRLALAVAEGPDREARLRAAIVRAIEENE